MNNKIRIARTPDLSAISANSTERIAYGQPFYDGAKKLLYIGATPEYSVTKKSLSQTTWTGVVYISQQTKLQQYFKSQDDTVNDIYRDIYILTYKGWTQTLLSLGYHTWQDQYGKNYWTPTVALNTTDNIVLRPDGYSDQGNIDYIGVKFTTGNLKDNPSAFVDNAQIIIKLKNSVNFQSVSGYRNITLFRPTDSINAYNVIGKIKDTPITDIFNLDNNGLIKEVKNANHATTATIGQYASSDTSKGTIEERLNALQTRLNTLNHKDGTITWLNSASGSGKITREGNYVIGYFNNVQGLIGSIFAQIPSNFRPQNDIKFGVMGSLAIRMEGRTNNQIEGLGSRGYITIHATGDVSYTDIDGNITAKENYTTIGRSWVNGYQNGLLPFSCYFGYEIGSISPQSYNIILANVSDSDPNPWSYIQYSTDSGVNWNQVTSATLSNISKIRFKYTGLSLGYASIALSNTHDENQILIGGSYFETSDYIINADTTYYAYFKSRTIPIINI